MSAVGFVQRLDVVEERLAGHAADAPRSSALTSADPASGERWDAGQVWAHLAEFIPYWIAQAQAVMASADEEPVAFGRTKTDPERVAAIARDRSQPLTVLWSVVHSDIEQLRQFLKSIEPDRWRAHGLHPTMGSMDVDRIVDEFLVGHLEQHADQLDELTHSGG
ncbi:MAG TPA: hypothetical protein VJU79_08460 [Candidatus Dormibacteraeota bacterium]|nr:hypothetical protein [Candidatus Dormibacteraeota bacterium]